METGTWVLELVSLLITSIVILVTFITNGLSAITGASNYGFKNNTVAVSDNFYTQITPAGYAFSIWGVIYTWQVLWLIYAWSFICRPKAVRTIFVGVYWTYALVNCCNIAWVYLWGNELIGAAFGVLVMFNFFQYTTVGLLWAFFYRNAQSATRADYWLTWVLPVNGIMFYATWTTIASLANLASVLQYSSSIGATGSGIVCLSLLTATVITYFIFENTVFDRFTRYVFSVYPVVIWALIAILAAHWEVASDRKNSIFVLVLLLVVIAHVVVRIVLFIVFTIWRPLSRYYNEKFVV